MALVSVAPLLDCGAGRFGDSDLNRDGAIRLPRAPQFVTGYAPWRRLVGGQHGDHLAEHVVQLSSVSAGLRTRARQCEREQQRWS